MGIQDGLDIDDDCDSMMISSLVILPLTPGVIIIHELLTSNQPFFHEIAEGFEALPYSHPEIVLETLKPRNNLVRIIRNQLYHSVFYLIYLLEGWFITHTDV
jgi:hypothetical protein